VRADLAVSWQHNMFLVELGLCFSPHGRNLGDRVDDVELRGVLADTRFAFLGDALAISHMVAFGSRDGLESCCGVLSIQVKFFIVPKSRVMLQLDFSVCLCLLFESFMLLISSSGDVVKMIFDFGDSLHKVLFL